MKHFALFIFFIVTLFVSCINDPVKVNSFSKNAKVPLQTVMNVDLLYSDSANLKVHMTAPMMEEYGGATPYEEMAKGVKVEFYNDSETVNSSLTANYAINKKHENIMEAKNDVVVVNIKGEQLNTEHLIWDGKKRRIHTDAFVKITTKDQIITGTGLDSDERFEEYEIKNISGTINLKDGPE
ncbi:MAG: LPS export ABC transporter periplasmic protein LptC [Bacteroidota bacterium]|nr:LPS export ABC transporter periplasmic protein LptC [Bacteroidota bacterium]